MFTRPLTATLIFFSAIMACRGLEETLWFPPPGPAAPVAIPGPFTIGEGTSLVIQLDPTNSIGNPVAYTASASNGTVKIDGTTLTYTPNTNAFVFADQISLTAEDLSFYGFAGGTIFVEFTPVPGPPVMIFTVSPLANFPGATNPVILCSSNTQLVSLELNGSGTYDPNLVPVSLSWYDGTNCLLAGATSGTAPFNPGAHTISLCGTDGTFTNSASETIEILTPSAATQDLETFIGQLPVKKGTRRDLQRIVSKAHRWTDLGKSQRAYIELQDLQRKLERHDLIDPLSSTEIWNAAQQIMDQLPAN